MFELFPENVSTGELSFQRVEDVAGVGDAGLGAERPALGEEIAHPQCRRAGEEADPVLDVELRREELTDDERGFLVAPLGLDPSLLETELRGELLDQQVSA